MIPYMTALALVSLLCLATWAFLRPSAVLRCLFAVLAVWCAGWAYGEYFNDFSHWQFNILTDGTAAVVILRRPAGKMQAALGGTYAVQVMMHVAYGARELWSKPDPVAYYDMLTLVAYAQLAILGGWCIGLWGRAALDRWRDRAGALDHRQGPARMGAGR